MQLSHIVFKQSYWLFSHYFFCCYYKMWHFQKLITYDQNWIMISWLLFHLLCNFWLPKFLVANSTIFHYSLCSVISMLWYNWIISNLNSLFFELYTFLFFNTKSFSIFHLLFFNTWTLVFSIFSTTFTISLFFASYFLIFLIIFSSASSINNYPFSITLIFHHFFFNITWFSLSLFTSST